MQWTASQIQAIRHPTPCHNALLFRRVNIEFMVQTDNVTIALTHTRWLHKRKSHLTTVTSKLFYAPCENAHCWQCNTNSWCEVDQTLSPRVRVWPARLGPDIIFSGRKVTKVNHTPLWTYPTAFSDKRLMDSQQSSRQHHTLHDHLTRSGHDGKKGKGSSMTWLKPSGYWLWLK